MRYVIVSIFLLFLFSSNSYAEKYMVEKPDGSVVIVQYVGGHDTLADVINELGLNGYPIERITDADLPKTRVDRKYWKRGVLKKIEINTVKKAEDEAAATALQQDKEAVLQKMGVSKAEYEKLTGESLITSAKDIK